MGDDNDEADEKPAHTVRIGQEFWLQTTEITQAQWQAVMGDDPSDNKGDDQAIDNVSWNDCQAFLAKLNGRSRRQYRLPTEAEWEYACRAGSTGKFCFGDDEDALADYGWFVSNCGGVIHPVGLKKPNGWGLYDMHGSVWEWCQDTYQSNYLSAPTDGSAWVQSGAARRVVRGGAWSFRAGNCQSATRYHYGPDVRFSKVGFRLARSIQ